MTINNIQDAFNRAKEFFVEGCEVYFVTSDGNVFLQENKHFAYNHASKPMKQKLEVFEVKKSVYIEPTRLMVTRRPADLAADNKPLVRVLVFSSNCSYNDGFESSCNVFNPAPAARGFPARVPA